jgi:hypothetical protein
MTYINTLYSLLPFFFTHFYLLFYFFLLRGLLQSIERFTSINQQVYSIIREVGSFNQEIYYLYLSGVFILLRDLFILLRGLFFLSLGGVHSIERFTYSIPSSTHYSTTLLLSTFIFLSRVVVI